MSYASDCTSTAGARTDGARPVPPPEALFQMRRWWAVGLVLQAVAVVWWSWELVTEQGNAAGYFLPAVSVPIGLLGLALIVRPTQLRVGEAGLWWRGAIRTREFGWDDVLSSDVVNVSGSWWPAYAVVIRVTSEALPSAYSAEHGTPLQLPRYIAASQQHVNWLVEAHIVAHRGRELDRDPTFDPYRPGWGRRLQNQTFIGIASLVGGMLVLVLMSWGFGMCRYGDCGEGWILTKLSEQAPTEWVEEAIVEDLVDDHRKVTAECPDRVGRDAGVTFTCNIFDGPYPSVEVTVTDDDAHSVDLRYPPDTPGGVDDFARTSPAPVSGAAMVAEAKLVLRKGGLRGKPSTLNQCEQVYRRAVRCTATDPDGRERFLELGRSDDGAWWVVIDEPLTGPPDKGTTLEDQLINEDRTPPELVDRVTAFVEAEFGTDREVRGVRCKGWTVSSATCFFGYADSNEYRSVDVGLRPDNSLYVHELREL